MNFESLIPTMYLQVQLCQDLVQQTEFNNDLVFKSWAMLCTAWLG